MPGRHIPVPYTVAWLARPPRGFARVLGGHTASVHGTSALTARSAHEGCSPNIRASTQPSTPVRGRLRARARPSGERRAPDTVPWTDFRTPPRHSRPRPQGHCSSCTYFPRNAAGSGNRESCSSREGDNHEANDQRHHRRARDVGRDRAGSGRRRRSTSADQDLGRVGSQGATARQAAREAAVRPQHPPDPCRAGASGEMPLRRERRPMDVLRTEIRLCRIVLNACPGAVEVMKPRSSSPSPRRRRRTAFRTHTMEETP